MDNTKNKGFRGESIACEYLINLGYKILERNRLTRFGELDIISKEDNRNIVFVEVKTIYTENDEKTKSLATYQQESGNKVDKLGKVRQNTSKIANYLSPEEHMSKSKITKTKRMAQWYFNQFLNKSSKNYRIDLIAIEINNKNNVLIRHYKNIT